jgi:transcriptional regulator GlxA family with amidase domain
MERELAGPGPEAAGVLLGLGRALAWELIRRGVSHGQSATGREWAASARAMLDATLSSEVSAREALSALPLSYRQLSRHFTDAYGCSPKDYQVRARVDRAGQMLQQTSLSVTAVAMELGYCSSQHFASEFRRITGQSPTAWRARAAPGQR